MKQTVLINDNVKNIIIFPTTENLNFFYKSNTIYVDGTFKSCCKMLTQMFTIQNNHYIPIIFRFLPSKSTDCYSQTFTRIFSMNAINEISILLFMLILKQKFIQLYSYFPHI